MILLQMQRFLGHQLPGFTLRVYGHPIDEGVGAPLNPTNLPEEAENQIDVSKTLLAA